MPVTTTDKFYTLPHVVDHCLNTLNFVEYDLVIEPSAGSCAFLKEVGFAKKIGMDIHPDCEDILKLDFLSFSPYDPSVRTIVVGNPPFGKNSSLAIRFFNHAAKFASTIAFILPKTFRKESIQNRLDPSFHLVYDENLQEDSFFLPDGSKKSIPCCWMIWGRRDDLPPRSRAEAVLTHPDFDFLDNIENADFMFQRVGVNAGVCHRDFSKAVASHLLIKEKVEGVFDRMSRLNWSDSCKYNTAGNPSISKRELIKKYSECTLL